MSSIYSSKDLRQRMGSIRLTRWYTYANVYHMDGIGSLFMTTKKPRIQVSLTTAQYELLRNLAELQDRSMGSIVSELFDQVHPVLERVAVVLQAAKRAQSSALDGLRQATEDAEAEIAPMVGAAMHQLDLLHVAATVGGPQGMDARSAAAPPVRTPEPVTRGSGRGVKARTRPARAIRRGSESTKRKPGKPISRAKR
jgi:hypothetical protein